MLRYGSRLLIIVFLASGMAWARDLALVAHKSNPAKNVTLADLTKMVKGATKKWPDGKDISFVIKDPSAAEMKLAAQKVYGMTIEELKALIVTLNQARKNTVLIVTSDDVLIKTVETTPGAVGMVDVYSITSGVNVLKIDGKSPLEPGYVLHGQ